ncbi:MAG: phytanoyl-CoA dioxygenase family protein [Alphaproteobacteria bacterium]|nr:phytanoyl-CoA dioxygenase family protein [Alphaproteobacteria bacterium]
MIRPFTDSTASLGDGATLARNLDRDGYLFLRGVIPREEVMALRRPLLERAAKAGWLKSGSPVELALADSSEACKDPEPRYLEHFRPMWTMEALHRMKHHPKIVGLFERIFGEAVLVHPMFVLRNIFPQTPSFDFTTGSHQDKIHIGGGTSYACWFSLGDCPTSKGGLIVAAGSHKQGVLDFELAPGAGGLEVSEKFEGRWVGGDFKAGDVLIFSDTTVHKALPNKSAELRQSFDARYQRLSDPVAEVSVLPYAGMFTWDEVYAGWQSAEYQYYWQRQGANVVPFDTRYYEKRDAIAFAHAARGDLLARDTLLRIVQRDKNAEKRERASKLLAELDRRYTGKAAD